MEFQAVIMAGGKGSRMTDLTAKCPKALLPVGNHPLVWYPVNMLERAGFEDVIIIALESSVAEINKALTSRGIKMKLDIVGIPDNMDWGTAESLRHIKDKIKTDVLILSCDLISDLCLHQIANLHQAYDSSVTMLLSSLPEQFADIPAPGVKSKKKATERDFIGFDEKGKRVLFLTSEADLEETIAFSKSTLKRHPYINIKSKLTDCHLYLLKKWVIEFLAKNQNMYTIKGELIPYLVRKQFQRKRQPDVDLLGGEQSLTQHDTKPSISDFTEEVDSYSSQIKDLSTWNDHDGDMQDCFHGEAFRCYAHIQTEGFCMRANTLSAYCEANRQIPRLLNSLTPSKKINLVHSSATVKEKSQIGQDCLVGEDVVVGEKVSVKRSVVGRKCTIGDKVKITGSVIMDNVHIAESCNIQGSIICSKAQISEKCELKDCIVGHTQQVIAMGKFTNEAIIDVEKMMEI